VRATDIDIFFKYRPDLFFLAREILRNASHIIFIGVALRDNFFCHRFIKARKDEYISKSIVLNNGIDSFWLSNIKAKKSISPHRILFVGRLIERKNITLLVEAINRLKKTYGKLQLDIVGGNGEIEEKVISIAGQHKWINYHGLIYDKEKLLKVYRENHIFAMPSTGETFGLVYVEALSQGLPILYSKGDGFDGILEKNIGEAVEPESIESISNGIESIINNYNSYQIDEIDFDNFDWLKIAEKYKTIYRDLSQHSHQ
jgi:glycosyltransferase involved in cell wall biosynthesis